jgi:hypothetical protein
LIGGGVIAGGLFLGATGILVLPKVVLYEKHKELIRILEEVKSQEYSERYQCLEFSKSLVKKLSAQGVPSRVEIVNQGEPDKYHAVVALQIEPQNGKIVKYETVDSCTINEEKLQCQNGFIEGQNMYVAGKSGDRK